MSNVLTQVDLRNIFALITSAQIPVGQVPAVWPSIQRLEVASKSGVDYIALVADPTPAQAEVDGNR